MKNLLLVVCTFIPALLFAQTPVETYAVDSNSVEHAGVPKGELLKFSFDQSKIFPGTFREYWVYVPAQYKADKPACVYVNQDGIQWKAPTVFDNLINKNLMPVTIGVFVTPGKVLADSGSNALNRFNRSFEYDGLGDAYTRFILNEILPEVEKQKTSDGRAIRLSKNGNDRAIGGSSSGAICAFTAAWQRPDYFQKVMTHYGSFTNIKGGHVYPDLVRKAAKKDIKVFIQDGANDLDNIHGNWWLSNLQLEAALKFKGYEYRFEKGTGGHNGKHAGSILPESLKWLWADAMKK